MTPERAFLADICERPDDDAPRLVYADWLEERGETDRATFIRAQCGVARFCRTETLTGVRADQLHPAHRRAFLAPLLDLGLWEYDYGKPDKRGGYAFIFSRGFVEVIDLLGAPAVARFTKVAEPVFAVTPLTFLRIPRYYEPGAYYGPYSSPDGGDPALTLARLRALLKLPVIGRLRRLDLQNHGLGDGVARALLKCPYLTNRTTVYLAGNYVGEEAAAALRARFGAAAVLAADDCPY